MKRQNKTGAAVKLSAVIVISSMMLGACAKTVQNQEIPAATYMGGNDTITGVCKDLDSAGASHVDTLFRCRLQNDRLPSAGWDTACGINGRKL